MDIMFIFCKKLCVFLILPTLFWSSAADFTKMVFNISACAGQDILLSWRYDSQDVVHQVLWFKDGNGFMIQIGSNPAIYTDNTSKYEHITNGEVKLHNLTTNDTGLYKIVIFQQAGSGIQLISDEAYLTVIEAPSLPSYTTNGRRFDCLVQALGSPAVEIFVKLGGIMLSSPSVTVDMTKPVDCCITGEAVACLAENTNNESSFCVNVFTPYGPRSVHVTPATVSYTLKSGQSLGNITCKADCNPACTYNWTKDRKVISNSSVLYYTVNGKEDSGTYMCTAVRQSYFDSVSIEVFVMYPASVKDFYVDLKPKVTTVVINKDESVELVCNVDSYPFSTIDILRSGTVLQHQTKSNNTLYRLYHASCLDSGTYECSAQNEIFGSTSSKYLQLYVTCSPASIDGQHQKVFAALSKSHVLKASVYGYPPPQTFDWYRKTQGIWTRMFSSSNFLIEMVGLHSNLTLINVTEEEFGDYGVKAYNGQENNNLFTKRFSVYKGGTPERPVDFRCHIFSNRTGSVVLEWEPGQNGGFLQTFVIQYHKEGDSQWKEHKVVENTKENNSMTAVLDELLANSVYIVRMYSTNVVGNSSVTPEQLLRTRGDGGPVAETCAWAGAAAGGAVGGLVVGSVISVAGLLMYQRLKDAGDKNMRHTRSSDKAKETAGVYYNVVEEKLADKDQKSLKKPKSGDEANQYEELKHRREEQQYEDIKNASN